MSYIENDGSLWEVSTATISPVDTNGQLTIAQPYSATEVSRSQKGVVWPISTIRSSDQSWFPKALSELNSLSNLRENWDTYGSPAIAPDVFFQVTKLLFTLSSLGAKSPHIVPASGGGIQLELETIDRELEIEVLPQYLCNFLLTDKSNQAEVEGNLNIEDQEAVAGLLIDLYGDTTQLGRATSWNRVRTVHHW